MTTSPGMPGCGTQAGMGRMAAGILFLAAALAAASPGAGDADELDVKVRGQFDVVGAPENTAIHLNELNSGGSAFDPWRLRLFVEGKASPNVEVFSQFLVSDVTGFYVWGAYATLTPNPERDLHLQVGKIPWPIGTYGPRTYSDKNPLVGAPLMYQYHTSFRAGQVAPDVDELLAHAGEGQFGVTYVPGGYPFYGSPLVYDACWDFGAAIVGSARPFEFSLGVTNGTPGSARAGRDDNGDKSIMGRVGVLPTAGLRLGVSASVGSYVSNANEPALPAGTGAEQYDQRLAMVDAEWSFGHVELRGEGIVNTWETPYVGNLTTRGGYIEGKYTFPSGLFAAARYDRLTFSDVQGTTGPARPWDADVTRFEGGLGYRIQRHVTGKLVYQATTRDDGTLDSTDDLVAGQLSFTF